MTSVVDDLAERGAALWVALGKELDTADGAVALEACRIVDRLDRLAALLAGDEDMFRVLEWPPDTGNYVLNVSNAMSQARQQATSLRQLLEALGFGKEAAAPPAPTGEEASPLAKILKLAGGTDVQPAAKPARRPKKRP